MILTNLLTLQLRLKTLYIFSLLDKKIKISERELEKTKEKERLSSIADHFFKGTPTRASKFENIADFI